MPVYPRIKTEEFKDWLKKRRESNPYKQAVQKAYKKYKRNTINNNRFSEDKKKVYLALNRMIREAFLDGIHNHLIKLPTGIGKTFIVIFYAKELVKTCDDIDSFVILSSEYKHGADTIDKMLKQMRFTEYIYLKGKKHVCLELDTIINKKGNTVKDFLKHNIPINYFCDEEKTGCQSRNICPFYYNNEILLREDSHINCWIGVHHHYNNYLPIFLMRRKLNTILIFEEDIESAIRQDTTIDIVLINTHRDFLNIIKKEIEVRIKEHEEEGLSTKNLKNFLVYISNMDNFLLELRKAILSTKHSINYSNIEACVSDLLDYTDSTNYLDKLNNELYIKIKENKYPIFNQKFRFILSIVKNYESNYEIGTEWLKNAFIIKENWFRKGNYFIDISYNDIDSLIYLQDHKNIEIIFHNDATGNKNYLETFYGKNEDRYVFIKEHNYLEEGISEIIYKNVIILQVKIPFTFGKSHNPNKEFGEDVKTTLQHEKTLVKRLELIRYTYKHLPNKLQPIIVSSRKITSKQIFVDKELKKQNPNYISLKSQNKSFGELVEDIDKSIKWVEPPVSSTNEFIRYRTSMTIGRPSLPYNPKEELSESKRRAIALNKTEKDYRDYYSRKTIQQFNGRIIRFVEGVELLIILFTGFEVYSKEFIERNKIKYVSVSSYQQYREFIKHYSDYEILKTYLLKNKTITIKQTEELLKIKYKQANRLLFNMMEKYSLLKSKREGVGGKLLYFLS